MSSTHTFNRITPNASGDISARARIVPNMIAIASGKGGVGKTFVSSSIGYALAKEGKNVLLFDGDLGLANIDVQLGLTPQHDIGSVIAGRVSLEQAICSAIKDPKTQNCPGRFDILAGKSGSGALNALSKPQLVGLMRGLSELATRYDYVFVDLPAGLDKSVTLLSTKAAMILVVVTDEPTSLTDAYAYIKVTSRQTGPEPFHVVINQANSIGEAKLTYQSLKNVCTNFLQIEPKLLGVVRKDHKVRDAIRHQALVFDRWPEASASEDLGHLSRKLHKVHTTLVEDLENHD